jgi:hypothetical protein
MSITNALDSIRAFERELDSALAARKLYSCGADASLSLAANMYEAAAARSAWYPGSEVLDRGITIFGRYLVSGTAGEEPQVGPLFADMEFASHYFMLREYLYYTYNAPGAMTWSISPQRVEVQFNDPTIPRQFFTAHNDSFLTSRDLFRDYEAAAEIRRLLKGEPEYAYTDNVSKACELIEKEVDLKLSAYFSILDVESEIDLGGYTYREFVGFYRLLLAKALYHRYFAEVNGAVGAIFISEGELLDAEDLDIPRPNAQRILNDMVFSADGAQGKADPSYFSLLSEGKGGKRIVMRPHHFAKSEGLVNLLRVVAQRRPQVFLTNVSMLLGQSFTRRVQRAFDAQGFTCHSEVSLRAFGANLPDIDLLVISEEPTLGFVLLICELKSPVPPRWAKDQLRALNADGVSKAFRQVEAVREFLKTNEGIRLIRGLLPNRGIPHFDGFLAVVEPLIITSDNAGMFFDRETIKVVNFRTLERLLRRSDGDMAFIQHVLRTYNQHADGALKRQTIEIEVGNRTVAYEGVTDSPILDFPEVKWRTSPDRQVMIDEFISSGAHPFDVLGEPTDRREDGDGDSGGVK